MPTAIQTAQSPHFALYVHIPYCVKKCPYCDFNTYPIKQAALARFEQRYIEALLQELKYYAATDSWAGQTLSSIFIGGGTPSLFSADSIKLLIETAKSSFSCTTNLEVTLEANPGTIYEPVNSERLKQYRQSGVSRISMGAQSFSDSKLKQLGRIHAAADIGQAVANLDQAGFSNFNLDLIFGTEGETTEQWLTDLEQAIALEPKHISAYSLTIEPNTLFYRRQQRGELLTAAEEQQAELYSLTQQTLAAAGFEQYEISNYALAGFECQHNLNYWKRNSYLGLGAGAHSFVTASAQAPWGLRWWNIKQPERYMQTAHEHGTTQHEHETLIEEQAELEFFFLGLRQRSGISRSAYQASFSKTLSEKYQSIINQLEQEQLVSACADQLSLTPKGYLFSDYVFAAFASN